MEKPHGKWWKWVVEREIKPNLNPIKRLWANPSHKLNSAINKQNDTRPRN
jgi:hypothetical protein